MVPFIQFIHGKESGPWGSKITYLADIARSLGYEVDSLRYTEIADPQKRVEKLVEANQKQPACILVGSSMSGWVAATASASITVQGLFLLAPALYMPDYPPHRLGCPGENIEIVHGWHDSLIPYQNVVRFAQENRCTLHLVDDEHRLKHKLDLVGEYFHIFLKRMRTHDMPVANRT